MQFNSYVFIMAFMPIMVVGYFLANKISFTLGKVVLITGSCIFYAYSDSRMILYLLDSICINYGASCVILKSKWKKIFLYSAIVVNVCLLLYFKYWNFIIENINSFMKMDLTISKIILPLGISFFTFQQIAYVVSVYKREILSVSLLDYLLYITYFPKLLMGPLTEPGDFIEEINNRETKYIHLDYLAEGLKIFSFGLLKKALLADTFASAVSWGYSNIERLSSMDLFLIMLCYTFQIYFDFSGYSDMAVGASRMLGISLPINFDSPYKAVSIRDFWKRWHISLTKFFTKYIYIPLGGARRGLCRTCINTMIIFLISGIWHGANWTFILWGILNGIFSVIERVIEPVVKKLIEPVRWIITFLTVNVLWLLFSAGSVGQWIDMLKKILCFQNTTVNEELLKIFAIPETGIISDVFHLDVVSSNIRGFWMLIFMVVSFGICLFPENNYRNLKKINVWYMVLAAIAIVWGILCLSTESVFVYFDF